jgi:hypothetical protein
VRYGQQKIKYAYYENCPLYIVSGLFKSKSNLEPTFKNSVIQTTIILLYYFFWVIPRRLNSDTRGLPGRKHTTFRIWQKFEIKNDNNSSFMSLHYVYFQVVVLRCRENIVLNVNP